MIYVFKTTVKTKTQAKSLGPHLNKLMPGAKWNFDFHDRDRILRIDSEENIVPGITGLLQKHNFHCEELQ